MARKSFQCIDIHQHFVPERYRKALSDAGISRPDGMANVPSWSEDGAIDMMDRLGIGTAFVSISSPGVNFAGPRLARTLARQTNEDAAELLARHPGRFGFFAVTPLPDIEAALEEIAYAFDVLKADGVIFETNFGGTYLGDSVLEPVYSELHRRNAVLFIHPTSPHFQCVKCTPSGDEPMDIALGYPRPMLEFMFETTRSIASMVLSGVPERFPNIKIVVPHAGACLPVLAGRIELLKDAGGHSGGPSTIDIRASLRRLHYDLAGAPVPELLGALLQIADRSRLHYGSDWPFTPAEACEHLLQVLINTSLLDNDERAAMMSTNATRIFPRLSARG
ncbi:amidohydrolase family protein [Agrobacterium tumefaciens]|uniref:amidohydrolase family protein n=1 Tax=Agrobacterium tumefaciens TaxID=358 RepID=UPI00384F5034